MLISITLTMLTMVYGVRMLTFALALNTEQLRVTKGLFLQVFSHKTKYILNLIFKLNSSDESAQ